MNENITCRECEQGVEGLAPDRRSFLRQATVGALALTASGGSGQLLHAQAPAPAAAAPAVKPPRPAEDLVRELHASLTDAQKRQVVSPWDHGTAANLTRHRIFNAARGQRIGQVYTPPQQELITRILRSLCSDDAGFNRIDTVIKTDNAGLNVAGADIYGDPTGNRPFAWVFTAHHLTLRCDGNSEPDTAFGGPMYYGRSQSGNNERNVFNFQTRSVRSVYDALSEQQRRRAVVTGTPGEGARSVEFRRAGEARPGLGVADLSADQRRLVEQVMRDILAPFRREDTDEVMELIRRNGGFERINLAFYKEENAGADENERWHFWRLEGPGFVWNYRILPHVHAYVNIARQA
jgi:hypothetical protein